MAAEAKYPYALLTTIEGIYKPAGMVITSKPVREGGSAGAEYAACRFGLNGKTIVFRQAKTTPKKIGQFVTILKRPASKNLPLDISDGIDFVVVSVFDETHCGQFVFDKDILLKEGVMSDKGKKGKMAIRVYPPWSKPIAKQAIKTQQWQAQYFFPISPNGAANPAQVRKIFHFAPITSIPIASKAVAASLFTAPTLAPSSLKSSNSN